MSEKVTVEQLTVALQNEEVLKILRSYFGPRYSLSDPLSYGTRLSESSALGLAVTIHGALYPKPTIEKIRDKVKSLRKRSPWPAFGLPLDDELTRQQARDAYNAAIDEVLDILGEP